MDEPKHGDLATAPTEVSGGARAVSAGGGCVSTDEILAMTEGALPPERVEAILVHVDRCVDCAAVLASLGQLAEDGRDLGRYRANRVLGSGAMGIVYDAWDPQLRRRVALKVVRPDRADASARERMLREARALARVNHPNVVAVYDVSERDGEVCVAAELVDGETLATWQAGRAPAEIAEAWLQAARGLAAAHAGGVVHRDVKPANVLVGRDGRVRVGDFGLARLGADQVSEGRMQRSASVSPDLPEHLARGSYPPPSVDDARITETGYVAGTPAYMAPEQARGEIDARSDQYALAVALAEALVGERPAADSEPRVPELPALEPILARCLRAVPGERYPSMDALVAALATALAPPAAPPRRMPIALAAGAGVLVVGAIVVWQAWPRAAICEAPAVPPELWSPARRAAIETRVPPEVAPRIDRWLAAWSDAAAATCANERDEVLRARSERCEREQLDELDDLLAGWTRARGFVKPADAHEAFENLPHPSECGHTAMVTRADPTAAQLAGIAALRMRLAADGASVELYAHARSVGYAPLVAEIATRVARATSDAHRDTALTMLRDAVAVVDRSGDDVARIVVRSELIHVLAGDQVAESTAAAETARTLVAKLGVPRLEAVLESQIGRAHNARSNRSEALIAYERGRRAAAIAFGPDSESEAVLYIQLSQTHGDREDKAMRAELAAARTIDAKLHLGLPTTGLDKGGVDREAQVRMMEDMLATAKRDYPGQPSEMLGEFNAATAQFIAEHFAEALPHFVAGEALAGKLGLRTDTVAKGYMRHAHALLELRRIAEAGAPAGKAVALAEELGDDTVLANTLTERAAIAIEREKQEHPASASASAMKAARDDLDRALTAYERAHAPASSRTRARYLFAAATWSSDPARAVALMNAAREEVERAIAALPADDPATPQKREGQQRRLAEIDAWFASHATRPKPGWH